MLQDSSEVRVNAAVFMCFDTNPKGHSPDATLISLAAGLPKYYIYFDLEEDSSIASSERGMGR